MSSSIIRCLFFALSCHVIPLHALALSNTSAEIYGSSVSNTSNENRNENGADVNACNQKNEAALKLAIQRGQLDTVKQLIADGVNVNACDKDGVTLLMWATGKGNMEILARALIPSIYVNLDFYIEEKYIEEQGDLNYTPATVWENISVAQVSDIFSRRHTRYVP